MMEIHDDCRENSQSKFEILHLVCRCYWNVESILTTQVFIPKNEKIMPDQQMHSRWLINLDGEIM